MVSSPKSRKRSLPSDDGYPTKSRRESVPRNDDPLLKLLVPDYVAGALIGKGGSSLSEMKKTFGGFVRISGGREYYPGTEERVVVITGEETEIENICNHIMVKVENPGRDESMRQVDIDPARVSKVKIVLTDNSCGRLIGRGGETIKGIAESSSAKLHVTMPEKVTYPGEKVLTISGSFDERISACRQVIEKVATDSTNMSNTMTKYPAVGTNAPRDVSFSAAVAHSPYLAPPIPIRSPRKESVKSRVTVEMEIPDKMVGSILGKQGAVVKEMVKRSGGARFKFADELKEGGEEKTLTITGNMEQAKLAHALINERIAEIEDQNERFQ